MFIIKEGTPADKIGEGTPKEVLDSINNFLKTQGYTIRNAAEDTSFTQAEIDKAFGIRNSQLEETIKKVTGVDRKAEEREKHYVYLERAVNEMKTASGNANAEVLALKQKISDLEKSGGNGAAIDEYKKQIADLQNVSENNRKKLEDQIAELQGKLFRGKVDSHVNSALSKLKAELKKMDHEDDVLAARLAKFERENKAAEFDGHVVFKDDKGNTRTSKKDGRPMTAEEILREEIFADLIDTGRKAGGAGTGGAGAGAAGGSAPSWKNIQIDKSVIKDKPSLYKHLANTEVSGLKENSKDFNEAFAELSKDLPLRAQG